MVVKVPSAVSAALDEYQPIASTTVVASTWPTWVETISPITPDSAGCTA
jgi:hypothetical protein